MTGYYLDTSVLVAALVTERFTEEVQAWLDGVESGRLFASEWVLTELSSALALKLRSGQIAAAEHGAALRGVAYLDADVLSLLPIEPTHFRLAATYVSIIETGLRAGDALHLAIAGHYRLPVATLDKGMINGARRLGIQVVHLEG